MICLNELSFVEQAEDAYEAIDLLRAFARVVGEAKLILNDNDITAHSQFYGRLIAPNVTVHDLLVARNTDQPTKVLMLALTKKGPFVDDLIRARGTCSCTACGQDVSLGGLAGAAHFGGVAVSLVRAGAMSDNPIAVQLCVAQCKSKAVPNVSEKAQLSVFKRNYRPIAKHTEHGLGTTMDLTDDVAQKVLDVGIVYGRRIFSVFEGTYYVFNSDNAGGFHGYPLEEADVPFSVRAVIPKKSKLL